jgi:hypothetical protein
LSLAAGLLGGALGLVAADAVLEREARPTPAGPRIENGWDPDTGRGSLTIHTPAGERIEVHLQDRFPGYTGGLALGSQDRPACVVHPADGGEAQAVWCAQDESLVLHTDDGPLEYSFGWSENLGQGPDGVPLHYLGGAIQSHDARGLLLAARHFAPPFLVERWLLVDPGGALLLRTRITNLRPAPLVFDWWAGEDPWVGRYGTADGDVGWAPGRGLILNEASLDPPPRALGIADQPSGLANAFVLGPDEDHAAPGRGTPTPDHVLFANRFAHAPGEVDPTRPLEAGSITAFNVGWTDRGLEPGESWEVSYALGRAERRDGTLAPPALDPAAWDRLHSAPSLPFPPEPPGRLRFVSERVVLTLLPDGDGVDVEGRYVFQNTTGDSLRRAIYFPFAVDADHPAPAEVEVEVVGGPPVRVEHLAAGVLFEVSCPPRDLTLRVRYRQACRTPTATYVVTSARAWGEPLARAEFVVYVPAGLVLEDASYPLVLRGYMPGGGQARGLTLQPFSPTRELSVRWRRRE